MKPFDYLRPDDLPTAISAVATHPGAVYLAGGTNLVDHLKLGVVSPDRVVDITGLVSRDIEDRPDGGLYVGAGVTNTDLAAHPRVRRDYPALAQALLAGASGQLRNIATTGGNLLQRTRCTYFTDPTTACNKRNPGSGCSARGGWTRYHAILGATADPTGLRDCVATHPSDMAVALLALDAAVHITGTDGERTLGLADLYRLPGEDPSRDTVLDHGDVITGLELPNASGAGRSAYRKVRDRASYAFALVSVAASLRVHDGVVREARIALGGVAHLPWPAVRAERSLIGSRACDESYRAAAAAELADAVVLDSPLGGNGYKIGLVTGTMTAVLRTLAEEAP